MIDSAWRSASGARDESNTKETNLLAILASCRRGICRRGIYGFLYHLYIL